MDSRVQEMGRKEKKKSFFLWRTYLDDGFERALAVRLIADVVVGSDQSHACVLHPVDVVFVRHHKHQADPERERDKSEALEMQRASGSVSVQSDRPSRGDASREAPDASQSCLELSTSQSH